MEYVIKTLIVVLKVILLCFFVGLIVIGQKNIGYSGLGMMVFGLCGILFLLYSYNKSHSH